MRIKTALSLAFLVVCAAPVKAQEQTEQSIKELAKATEIALSQQDWEGVIEASEAILELQEDNGRAWYFLGYALHANGELEKALQAHIKASGYPDVGGTACYNAACVFALKGEKDQAFEWLGKAVKAGFAGASHMATDPDLASLRDDPRYEKVIQAIGSMQQKGSFQAYAQKSPRDSARLSFWNQKGSIGQVVIDYGPVEWKEEFAQKMESPEFDNTRWRLGSNFWTSLDCNIDLTLGETRIPAGQYYLTLERRDGGEYVLVLLDPVAVRAKKLDAYLAQYTKGGIEVPMEYTVVDSVAEKLAIEIGVGKEDNTKGKLAIRFGPHVLAAPVTVHL